MPDIENARLRRFREKLTDYAFDVTWSPGKCHLIADALSRAPVAAPQDEEVVVNNVALAEVVAGDPALQPLYDAAAEDEDYQDVRVAFLQGKQPKVLPPLHPARQYKSNWDDISLFDNNLLVYKDCHLIIPKSLRKTILAKPHLSHAGISKTRALSQQLYFWPGISKDISTLIENCEACQLRRPSQSENTLSYQEATKPMQAVSLDLFDHAGTDHLVMVNRYSNYIWATKLNKTTTEAVTRALNQWFLEYGYPCSILSDNGPQFRSAFEEYCKANQIVHNTSSPYNHQSNSLAELAVKASKKLLAKSDSLADFKVRLQAWRNVPTTGTADSPSEKFFGRRQRYGLPELNQPPLPTTPREEATKLTPLTIGDYVAIQDVFNKEWNSFGTIVQVQDSGLSYEIQRDSGSTIARN